MKEPKYRWAVYGADVGGEFTNLRDARRCAKEASTLEDNDVIPYEALVWRIDDGCWYFKYEHGKCTYDGWTIKK